MVSVCKALNWVVWTSNYDVGRYKTNASSLEFDVNYVPVEYFEQTGKAALICYTAVAKLIPDNSGLTDVPLPPFGCTCFEIVIPFILSIRSKQLFHSKPCSYSFPGSGRPVQPVNLNVALSVIVCVFEQIEVSSNISGFTHCVWVCYKSLIIASVFIKELTYVVSLAWPLIWCFTDSKKVLLGVFIVVLRAISFVICYSSVPFHDFKMNVLAVHHSFEKITLVPLVKVECSLEMPSLLLLPYFDLTDVPRTMISGEAF